MCVCVCVWRERVRDHVCVCVCVECEGGGCMTVYTHLSRSLTLDHCLDGIGRFGYFNIDIKYLSIRTLQLDHRHGDTQPVGVREGGRTQV